MALRIRQLTVGPLEENCFLLVDPDTKDAVLIDPGDEPDRLLEAVAAEGATLRAIWLTHAHFDHVGGIAGVIRRTPVPIWVHPADQEFYQNAATHGSRWGLVVENPPPSTDTLGEGDRLTLGAYSFDVWHVPGHSPGQVALIGHGLCIAGDLLFAGSIGRTDLPLSDPVAMHSSLQRLVTLDEGTRVLPGHGVTTTIGRELASNPFLRGAARPIGA